MLVHTYDASISISVVAHTCHGKSNLLFLFAILQIDEEFLVSAAVNVKYNIDRDQKKPVNTRFIGNLEMKSPTVFCFAEVEFVLFTEGRR